MELGKQQQQQRTASKEKAEGRNPDPCLLARAASARRVCKPAPASRIVRRGLAACLPGGDSRGRVPIVVVCCALLISRARASCETATRREKASGGRGRGALRARRLGSEGNSALLSPPSQVAHPCIPPNDCTRPAALLLRCRSRSALLCCAPVDFRFFASLRAAPLRSRQAGAATTSQSSTQRRCAYHGPLHLQPVCRSASHRRRGSKRARRQLSLTPLSARFCPASAAPEGGGEGYESGCANELHHAPSAVGWFAARGRPLFPCRRQAELRSLDHRCRDSKSRSGSVLV